MQTYNFLPGTIVNTVDGGLAVAFNPADDTILVLGTAAEGPVGNPFQVTSLNVTSQTYDSTGSLYRALAEATSYSDNAIAYRIGTSPLILNNVGKGVGYCRPIKFPRST